MKFYLAFRVWFKRIFQDEKENTLTKPYEDVVANKELIQVYSRMFHELTPNIRLLLDECDLLILNAKNDYKYNDRTLRRIVYIKHSAQIVKSIIDTSVNSYDLVELSKTQVRNNEENKICSIKDIVVYCKFHSSEFAETQDIKIDITDLEEFHIRIDEHLIRSTLISLIKNSVESFDDIYREDKYIKISTSVISKTQFEITMADNGKGMDDLCQMPELIFQEWFSTKSIRNNYAYGLSILQKVVESELSGKLLVVSWSNPTIISIQLPINIV